MEGLQEFIKIFRSRICSNFTSKSLLSQDYTLTYCVYYHYWYLYTIFWWQKRIRRWKYFPSNLVQMYACLP